MNENEKGEWSNRLEAKQRELQKSLKQKVASADGVERNCVRVPICVHKSVSVW